MPPLSAKSDSFGETPRNVIFVVYPDIVLLDLVGPLQVFTHARCSERGEHAYKTHVVSLDGGAVSTNTILPIDSIGMSDFLDGPNATGIDTLVIVGGDGAIDAMKNAELLAHIKSYAGRARRVCSVCSGALVLAATGLLDGRRAVTHWEDCDFLSSRFPTVELEVDPIFIKDGPVWTSAGITAGIDMALAIVQEDLGRAPALEMARSLVAPMIRTAGQSQFSAELALQSRDETGKFADLHEWMRKNLSKSIDVGELAAKCSMSARNFSRRYTETIGVSPAKSLESMRVAAAKNLLLTTSLTMKTVASECGFKNQEKMRRAFHRHLSTSPSSYKASFGEYR